MAGSAARALALARQAPWPEAAPPPAGRAGLPRWLALPPRRGEGGVGGRGGVRAAHRRKGGTPLGRGGRAWAAAPTGNMIGRMARERRERQAAAARLAVAAAAPDAAGGGEGGGGERKWGEGWLKTSDQFESPTLKGFRQLFEHRKERKLGPAWHAWQLFLACTPSLFIMFVCSFVTGFERPDAPVTAEEIKAFQKLRLLEHLEKNKPGGRELLGAAASGPHPPPEPPRGEQEAAAAGGLARSKEEEELFFEFLRWKEAREQLAQGRAAPASK